MSRNSFLKEMFRASTNSPSRDTGNTGLAKGLRSTPEDKRKHRMQPGPELCSLFGVAPPVPLTKEQIRENSKKLIAEERIISHEKACELFAKRKV